MNDTIQQVSLYYSGAIGATSFDPVENAFVVVTETGGVEHPFTYAGEGKEVHFKPQKTQRICRIFVDLKTPLKIHDGYLSMAIM